MADSKGKEHEARKNEYSNFLQQTAEIRESGKVNEEEYIAWMNQYWENVKEDTKIRNSQKHKK